MNTPSLLNQRYQIEAHIASGGMADVYRARDLMLDRTVAIKILRDELSSSATFRERFRQEARSAANLSHPSIVTIHDFGLDNGKLFLVMEYIPGKDLKSILRARGRLPVNEALPLLIQACAGLGYAHSAGLIHCDVKPQNLIVTPDARLKITDFGIARALSATNPDEQARVVWGSPQYFSPEQAAGKVPSPASDVYSLGVVMYEVLTGSLPFNAGSSTELSALHQTAVPMAPRQLNPDIPPILEQIILKVLSKEPSARYRSADQLGRALMSTQRPLPAQSQPVSTPKSPASATAPTISSPVPTYTNDQSSHTSLENSPRPSPLDIDWSTWGLALLALIAVGGLIPLWLWVYFLYFPLQP